MDLSSLTLGYAAGVYLSVDLIVGLMLARCCRRLQGALPVKGVDPNVGLMLAHCCRRCRGRSL